MAYCAKCGRRIQTDARFCAYCGAVVREERKNDRLRETARKLDRTPDYSERYARADVRTNRTMAMLAYPSVLIVVPILFAPRSHFARFHVNQAMLPNLVGTALLLCAILLTPTAAFFGWLCAILDLPLLALRLMGFFNAYHGKAKELPFIGKFRFFQ